MKPIQPIEKDNSGHYRFVPNKIVKYLLDEGPFILSDLACLDFSDEDWEQFAQLIGYSLGGFGELSYVSDDTYETVERMAKEGMDEKDAKIAVLEEKINKIRDWLRNIVPEIFSIHPDDLNVRPNW